MDSESLCCDNDADSESIFNRCEQHRYNKMSVPEASNFRDLKKLLAELDPDTDDQELPIEIKRRAHLICARFLGGAWKTLAVNEMCLSRIKGGMSNMLFLCRLPEHHPPLRDEADKMLLRVYFNPEIESHLVAESVIFTLLSERHLGPKLFGIFSGGRLEEYIPSRPLSCSEIGLPMMARKIAKRLARVHMLDVPIWKEPDYICDALERWLQQLVQTPSGAHPFEMDGSRRSPATPSSITCAQLAEELAIVRRCIAKSNSPVVFCHNDLQEGNILLPKASSGNIRMSSITEDTAWQRRSLSAFNPSEPRLVLIDFEYASYNYRAFDFANHFSEYTINYDVQTAPFYTIRPDHFPSDDQQRDFFEAYLCEHESESGIKPDGELYERVERVIAETRPFVAVAHFFWGVWGLLQVEVSPVGFGFAEYGRDRLALYFEEKKHLLSLDSERK
uniref:Choline/ethanolamine kinase n=1 Tax=Plectus sambesii TaxID=2011161 RepID=A0A914VE19_9BILA